MEGQPLSIPPLWSQFPDFLSHGNWQPNLWKLRVGYIFFRIAISRSLWAPQSGTKEHQTAIHCLVPFSVKPCTLKMHLISYISSMFALILLRSRTGLILRMRIHISTICPSLVLRLLCGRGGKRAWYTLFTHAPSSLANLHTTLLH